MIGKMFLKEFILIGQMDQKECDICHYQYFLNKVSTRCLQRMPWFMNDVYEP